MSKGIKAVLRIFGVLIAAVLVSAIVLIGWLTITEFKPEPEKTVPVSINGQLEPEKDVLGKTLRVLTFNIGYGNLGKESDFFMDGGKNVRNGDKELVLKNLEGVLDEMKNADADIIFLQEVDNGSTRSFKTAQFGKIKEEMEGFRAAWAANYACKFVPYPLPPIGEVRSGIVTLSELDMTVGNRISLPCPFKWPVSAANLKRCLLVTYTDIEGTDKQLVTVNLHLEAYDDGEGKIAQTKMLWDVLKSEYAKGNYVIAGGDFNQTFPGAVGKYQLKDPDFWTPGVLSEEDVPEGWSYVFDDSVPTCRLLNKPYDKESAQHYVIDGFIISPNVELVSVGTVDAGFEFSDHNPVVMEIVLK